MQTLFIAQKLSENTLKYVCINITSFLIVYFPGTPKPTVKQERLSDVEVDDEEETRPAPAPKRLHDPNTDAESPVSKCLKTESTFQCESCSYSADKMSSLNRHRRIHNRSSDDCDKPSIVNTPVSMRDKFCCSCNIQFSSLSTYNCHKEFYCSKNKVEERSESDPACDNSVETMPPVVSINTTRAQLLAGMLLQPEQMMSHARVAGSTTTVIGQTTVIFAAPITAPNGLANMGITMPTVIVQPIVAQAPQPDIVKPQVTSVNPVNAHQKDGTAVESCIEKPLDLSRPKGDVHAKTSPNRDAGPTDLSLSPSRENSQVFKNIKLELASPKSVSTSPVAERFAASSSPTSPRAGCIPIPSEIAPFVMSQYGTIPIAGTPGKHIMPSSVSKCLDCSIVFYKHENYLIHKEHYCSGKKPWAVSPRNTEESSKSSEDSHSTSPNLDVVKPDPASPTKTNSKGNNEHNRSFSEDDITYKFFCIPCKIKFSSASTLKAHKEFYCPHGKDSGHTVIIQPPAAEENEEKKETEATEFRCNQCDTLFTTARLLKLHICSGDSSQLPLLRCPYCDYITQTDTRLTDHMKVHAPTRAFRCTLCGYRGNTVRGMRMHGKMHVDAGEEFTDENMVVFEEPPLIPITITNERSIKGPINMEAELIRMKNEPYKRRRSRKSYEKSENLSPPAGSSHCCPLCGDRFANVRHLSMHMKIHEMVSYQRDFLCCNRCEFTGSSVDDLLCHKNSLHAKEGETNEEEPSPLALTKSPLSTTETETPIISKDETIQDKSSAKETLQESNQVLVTIKEEPVDSEYETVSKNVKNETKQDCLKCNKENFVKTETVQNGFQPSISPVKNSPPTSPNNGTVPGIVNGAVKRSHSPVDEDKKSAASHSVLFQSGAVFPYFIIPSSSSTVSSTGENVGPPRTVSTSDKPGYKYCKNCDISFTYLSTFVAHKKYYCNSKPSDGDTSTTVA